MLTANHNISHFSLLLLIIGQISCFGKSQAFQPAKPNVLFFFFTFFSYLFLQHVERGMWSTILSIIESNHKDTNYDHGHHLASRFCLDPEDYEVVSHLVVPPSCRLVVPAGCRIASPRPLIALPSSCLVAPAGCLIASRCLSLRHLLVNS